MIKLGCQFDNSVRFQLLAFRPKVTLGTKVPMQSTNDGILQPLNIELNLTVDLERPRGKSLSAFLKSFNAIDAHVSCLINGSLQVHSVRMHNDRNQVVILASSLLFPV